MITDSSITTWVETYVRAWRAEDAVERADALATLFTEDAESHEWPYETHWVGRHEIEKGWTRRLPWQEGGWTFDWQVLAVNGDTFVVRGLGRYTELGTFDNLWVVTIDEASGRCSTFRMWNNEVTEGTELATRS